jgi:hypothetical protein
MPVVIDQNVQKYYVNWLNTPTSDELEMMNALAFIKHMTEILSHCSDEFIPAFETDVFNKQLNAIYEQARNRSYTSKVILFDYLTKVLIPRNLDTLEQIKKINSTIERKDIVTAMSKTNRTLADPRIMHLYEKELLSATNNDYNTYKTLTVYVPFMESKESFLTHLKQLSVNYHTIKNLPYRELIKALRKKNYFDDELINELAEFLKYSGDVIGYLKVTLLGIEYLESMKATWSEALFLEELKGTEQFWLDNTKILLTDFHLLTIYPSCYEYIQQLWGTDPFLADLVQVIRDLDEGKPVSKDTIIKSIKETKFTRWNSYACEIKQVLERLDEIGFLELNEIINALKGHPLFSLICRNLDKKTYDNEKLETVSTSNELEKYTPSRLNIPIVLEITFDLLPENEREIAFENYHQLVTQYLTINQKASATEAWHARHYDDFFMTYAPKIVQLTQIMGADAFKYLSGQLAFTTLTLERFLKNNSPINHEGITVLKTIFEQHRKEIMGSKRATWNKFLELSSLHSEINSASTEDTSSLITIFINANHSNISLDALYDLLFQDIIEASFKILNIDPEQIDPTLMKRIDIKLFPKLIRTLLKMKNDTYCEIYWEMLRRDLTGEKVSDFLHDLDQENHFGKLLSLHNQKINQQLESAGINTVLAMNYPHKVIFSYGETDKKTALTNFSNALDHFLTALEKSATHHKIIAFLTQLKCNKERNIAALSRKVNRILLEKINGFIKQSNFDESLSEPCRNYTEAYQTFCSTISEEITVLKNAETFEVKQWDKNDILTYWLGDYVGCCLATDGLFFNALIQRRMDDAMLFHVVTEKATNKPIALTWLYFATDTQNPTKIVVVANFVEINTKYAKNDKTPMILEALFSYTQQYCEQIGASAFLINHLNYGNIPDFTCFDQKATRVEKVGGFLKLSNESEEEQKSLYYLASLDVDQFHLYSAEQYQASNHLPHSSVYTSASSSTEEHVRGCSR